MAGPHVSVVIPTGSVDRDLAEQLAAISAQDAPFDFEVVLSLNSSAADAGPQLYSLLERHGDPRIRMIDSSSVRGASHARNAGLEAAEAEIVAFCDADDVAHPAWLAQLILALDSYDAVGGHLDDDALGDGQQVEWRPPTTPGALPTFLGVPYIVSANLALRRTHFIEAGGFDTELVRCEDLAFSWSLLKHGRTLGYAPDAVIAYRHRQGIAAMLHQHYLYGRGMSQVLERYGLPEGEQWARPTGLRMLKPNGAKARHRSVVGTMRRGSIAAGRVVGLAEERLAERRKPVAPVN